MEIRCIFRQAACADMVLMMLTLVTNLNAAQEINVLKPLTTPGSTKTLHFPSQFSGSLSVEPETGWEWDPRHVDERTGYEGNPGEGSWIQGDMTVPADLGVRLTLVLAPTPRQLAQMDDIAKKMVVTDPVFTTTPDLSGLSELDPNDLCWVRISSPFWVLREDGDRMLEPVFRLTGLQVLSLFFTGLSDKGMERLRSLRSLRALMFSGENLIRNPGLDVLKDLPNLEYLDLDTGATDVGLKHLAECPNLRWLRIRTGRIRGPGLAALADIPHLERLCLWGTSQFSDRHIRYLEGLTHLKSLTLWSCAHGLTDASLASIGKIEGLQDLYLIRCRPRFSAAEVARHKGLKIH